MQLNRFILFGFIFAGLGWSEINAQSMNVKEYTGTQTTYHLSSISKLNFSSGNLIISRSDSSSATYNLSILRYLNFTDSVLVNIDDKNYVNNNIKIYPNPVYQVLKIDLSGAKYTEGTLNIFSSEGKLLRSEEIKTSGIVSVDVSHLPRGTYICHFSNEAEMKSIILFKQ